MKDFEKLLKNAKPMTGENNDFQYRSLKNLLPDNLTQEEHDYQIKRICKKIKY